MAAESRGTDTPLEDVFFQEGFRFEFFQAVRLLERFYPHRFPVGREANPAREVVRFRAHVSLGFPPSQIYEIRPPPAEERPAEMTVTFMGLTGPLGTLPTHYTELLIEQVRQKETALRDFLDLLHHRFIALFYRAWEKSHFPIAYERSVIKRDAYDAFSHYLFDLIGIGTPGLLGRMGVNDEGLLHYAGIIAQKPPTAHSLENFLSGYFELPVTVQQFIGQWLSLPEEYASRIIGLKGNNALGVNAVLGNQVWDQQAKFRIRVGPLSAAEFNDLLPSDLLPCGARFRNLVQLTCFFAGQVFDFDVQLILKAAEVPQWRLAGEGTLPARLGLSTWLKTRDFKHDADDTVISNCLMRREALPSDRSAEGRRVSA